MYGTSNSIFSSLHACFAWNTSKCIGLEYYSQATTLSSPQRHSVSQKAHFVANVKVLWQIATRIVCKTLQLCQEKRGIYKSSFGALRDLQSLPPQNTPARRCI